jgi:hypothetical protein
MPDAPLIVLTAMGIDPFMAAFAPEPYLRKVNAGKLCLYTALANSVAHGENRVLEDAVARSSLTRGISRSLGRKTQSIHIQNWTRLSRYDCGRFLDPA